MPRLCSLDISPNDANSHQRPMRTVFSFGGANASLLVTTPPYAAAKHSTWPQHVHRWRGSACNLVDGSIGHNLMHATDAHPIQDLSHSAFIKYTRSVSHVCLRIQMPAITKLFQTIRTNPEYGSGQHKKDSAVALESIQIVYKQYSRPSDLQTAA